MAPSDPATFAPLELVGRDREAWDAWLQEAVAKNPDLLKDPYWRLNNLYWITGQEIVKKPDPAGRMVDEIVNVELLFRMRPEQQRLWDEMWYWNLVLKSRQHGFTTLICLFFLDSCLFSQGTHAGIIAHTIDDVRNIFREKVRFPYEALPEWLRAMNPARQESAHELVFESRSMLRVGLSLRSGTYQMLLISEYGKICAKYPEKATEIRTGALNTIHAGSYAFIESTAEGQAGDFYDRTRTAQNLQRQRTVLTKLDWKFHFFAWWQDPKNVLPPEGVPIPDRLVEYFEQIEGKIGRKLRPEQRAWYAKKEAEQGEFMFREHPSVPEEAFWQSLEGTYFATQMAKARAEGRLTSLPFHEGAAVDTWWDIGVGDSTAIWFTQRVGGWIHCIDYYENSGEGVQHYKKVLDEKREKYGWIFGRHVAPHDIRDREWGNSAKTRLQSAAEVGLIFEVCPQIDKEATGIQAIRNTIGLCRFDIEHCEFGIRCLDSYRKEWNEHLGCWRDRPLHDWSSHGVKAFQTLALMHDSGLRQGAREVGTERFAT